mgnify:CR=1 FL=1
MKCTIKYKNNDYDVSIKDKVFIIAIKSNLYIKRCIRKIRAMIPENINLYLFLTGLWIVFGVCNYYFYSAFDYRKSVLDVFIELKNTYFTTVILAMVMNIYNINFNYHNNLVRQHEFYVDTMNIFENVFGNLLGDEKHKYIVFYSDLCLKNTLDYVKKINKQDISKLLNSKEFQNDLEELIEYINRIRYYFNSAKYFGKINNYALNSLEKKLKNLKNNLNNPDTYLKNIDDIAYSLCNIINILREPWRKDIESDIKIFKIIEKNNADCIKADFYYNMLVYGHDFSKKY